MSVLEKPRPSAPLLVRARRLPRLGDAGCWRPCCTGPSAKPRLAGSMWPARNVPGFLRCLFRVCSVFPRRGRGPVYMGGTGGHWGGRERFAPATILCNAPIPAGLPRVGGQKREAPLPARIQTIDACQTSQDLNRSPGKPVQKWTGCLRAPLGPAAWR